MSSPEHSGEIENPKTGDSVVSRCGGIKVSLAVDGSLPVTRLSKKKGSFNIQLFYEGSSDPDTVVFRTDDPSVPLYRCDATKTLTRIRVISNPV